MSAERPCSSPSGRPLARESLAGIVAQIGRRAGIARLYPHWFRHTFGVTYLRAGGGMLTLQRILGHTTLVMVNRYLHLAASGVVDPAGHACPPAVAACGIDARRSRRLRPPRPRDLLRAVRAGLTGWLDPSLVTLDHRPQVLAIRPLALVTPHVHLTHDARGIDEGDGRPRHVPRLEVDPNIYTVGTDHLALDIRQQREREAFTRGERGHGVEPLPVDAGDGRAPPGPLVQLDLEPRQVALAAQSPGMPQKDQEQPPAGKVPQSGARVGSGHGEIEVRRRIAGCERRRALGARHGRSATSRCRGGETAPPPARRPKSRGLRLALLPGQSFPSIFKYSKLDLQIRTLS